MPWKVIIEAEGFTYGGTFTRQLKKARAQGWIPPEETLPPARRSDGKRVGLTKSKPTTTQELPMSEETVAVFPGQLSIEDADTAPNPVAVSTLVDIMPTSQESGPLAQVQTLEHYEQIIAQGIQTFIEVGRALKAIRDQELYRQNYQTFEAYMHDRWGMSRPRGYQLIGAAEVVDAVSTSVDIVPVNEAQARPLTTLSPEQQREVWQQVVETAPPSGITAKHVKATVQRVKNGTTAPKMPKPKVPAPAPQRPPRQRVQDGLFGVLAMVKDEDVWTILGELALALNTYADDHEDPTLQQHMEQALSPLWHLIEDHTQGPAGEIDPLDVNDAPDPSTPHTPDGQECVACGEWEHGGPTVRCESCGAYIHEDCRAHHAEWHRYQAKAEAKKSHTSDL
jgi:hypothetical protein